MLWTCPPFLYFAWMQTLPLRCSLIRSCRSSSFFRLVRSVRAAHDDAVLTTIAGRLDDTACERLDALLADDGAGTPYTHLSADPGKVGLDSLLAEINRLALVRGTGLPRDLLSGLHPDAAKRLRRRAAVESAWERGGTRRASACRVTAHHPGFQVRGRVRGFR